MFNPSFNGEIGSTSLVGNRYMMGPEIGRGFTGKIFLGIDTKSDVDVSIKLESVKTNINPMLLPEWKILMILEGGIGIPNLRWFGHHGDYSVLVLDPPGPSLEDIFNGACNGKFSLKTVLLLADQMIDIVEHVHSRGYLHRQIQPRNFYVATDMKQLFITDFALATEYVNPSTCGHIPLCDGAYYKRWFSDYDRNSIQPSRKDDLEALGCVLLYFLKGYLPWLVRVKDEWNQDHFRREMEMLNAIKNLCESSPCEFLSYFQYCWSLPLDSEPDYAYLKKLFFDVAIREGLELDGNFDWTSI